MDRLKAARAAPRCSATAKHSKLRCQAPAVKGWRVCRCHGARGGAPTGKRNGRYRHGMLTKEMRAEVQEVREMMREARAGLEDVSAR